MWDEVVKSNIASWEASVKWANENEEAKNFGSYHALHWLMYGLTQQGQFAEAKKLLDDMDRYAAEKPTENARGYLVSMKANYLAETGGWAGEGSELTCETDDLNVSTRALALFAEGMKTHADGDAPGLGKTIAKMEEDRKSAANLVSESGLPMCAAPGADRNTPNQQDIDEARIFELQLRALLAGMVGTPGLEEDFLKQAAQLESEVSYSYGPPHIALPTYEQYGRWLLDHDRPAEAATQFDRALEKGPKRRRALMGRLEAAQQLGEAAKVAEMEGMLREILPTAL